MYKIMNKCNNMQYNEIPCNNVQYNRIYYNIMQYHTTQSYNLQNNWIKWTSRGRLYAIMYHVSCIMYNASCIMHHASCIMCHASCIKYLWCQTELLSKKNSRTDRKWLGRYGCVAQRPTVKDCHTSCNCTLLSCKHVEGKKFGGCISKFSKNFSFEKKNFTQSDAKILKNPFYANFFIINCIFYVKFEFRMISAFIWYTYVLSM